MKTYSEIYSKKGIKEMIEEREKKIKRLQIEKKDIGISWTKKKIENHCKMLDYEIFAIEQEIKELKDSTKNLT